MARSHARLTVSVWTDEDFGDLTLEAQWLFAYLLAHPKLTLCGVLDLRTKRWARLPRSTPPEVVEAALVELEAHGYVLVDWEEEEVMIRTFTVHDLAPGRMNRNLATGFWRAYDGILSPDLRAALLRIIPEPVWAGLEPHAPEAAVSFRRSPRLEPEPAPRFEPDPGSRSQPEDASRFEPPATEACPPKPGSDRSSQSDLPLAVDNGTDALREPRLQAVPGDVWPGAAS